MVYGADMMKLYYVPPSVYAAKVRIALRLKNLEFEQVLPPSGYSSDAYRAIVPSGTIPALEVDDDVVLFETEAIVEYLDEKFPTPPLLPEGLIDRAFARAGARYHDTRIEPIVRGLFKVVPDYQVEGQVFQDAANLIMDRLERMTEIMPLAPYLAGPKLTVADLAFPATFNIAEQLFGLARVSFQMPEKVTEWRQLLLKNDVIAETAAEIDTAFAKWIISKTQ